jgi:hypothetical protein
MLGISSSLQTPTFLLEGSASDLFEAIGADKFNQLRNQGRLQGLALIFVRKTLPVSTRDGL